MGIGPDTFINKNPLFQISFTEHEHMKTENYNPSVFEVQLAKAIMLCTKKLQEELGEDVRIIDSVENYQIDNPMITLHLEDGDGDVHELVIQVIQRPDKIGK
jgi:hypothetical protein